MKQVSGFSDVAPGKWKVTGGGIYMDIAKGKTTLEQVQKKLDSKKRLNYE